MPSTQVYSLSYVVKYVLLVYVVIRLCEADSCFPYANVSSFQCGSGPAEFTYKFDVLGNIQLTDDDVDDYGCDAEDQELPLYVCRTSNFHESTLTKLNLLSLEGEQIKNFTSNSFHSLANSSTLNFLNMRYVSIGNVENDALKLVRNTLINLDLANAKMSLRSLIVLTESLSVRRNECFSTLVNLGLANMNLHEVPFEALQPVRCSLRALSLFGNNFETARVQRTEETLGRKFNKSSDKESHWATFPLMPSLLELDLRSCKINYIGDDFFVNLGSLKALRVSHNNILIVPAFAFRGLRSLLILDISYNRYEPNRLTLRQGITLENNSFGGLESLRVLNLTESIVNQASLEFLNELPPSLEELSLCRAGLTMLGDESFGRLSKLKVLDLSYNFGLGTELTARTFAGLGALQELHLSGIALQDLSFAARLGSLRTLNVRCNNLVYLEDLLSPLVNLTTLDLSFNFITSWNRRIFLENDQLSTVLLHYNALNVFTNAMLSDFKSLNYLSIGNNRLICNCNLKEFVEYARIEDYTVQQQPRYSSTITHNFLAAAVAALGAAPQNTTVIMDYHRSFGHACLDMETLENLPLANTTEFCRVKGEDTEHRLSGLGHTAYIIIVIVMAILSLGGLIYWKWWYVRYFAVFIKNIMLLRAISSENHEGRIYIYDMFVSYSNENRNWVIQELLPNLEKDGAPSRLRVCLHERDFQIGVSIIENIMTGMDQSRTLLLIISNSFLKSQWCQFEMHLAQHRLLEMCREELILILLEEIPRRRKPRILQYLMMTKTYIVWPGDDKDELAKEMFWKRLKKSIDITGFRAKQWSTA